MELQISIETRSNYLYVQLSGKFDIEKGKKSFMEVIETAKRNELKCILIDSRNMDPDFSIMDRYSFGDFSAKMQRTFRVAYVLSPDVATPEKFGENVMVNRGATAKVTTDIDEALEWLQQDNSF